MPVDMLVYTSQRAIVYCIDREKLSEALDWLPSLILALLAQDILTLSASLSAL